MDFLVSVLAFIAALFPSAEPQVGNFPAFYPDTNGPHYIVDISDGCAQWASNVLTTTGSACGSGSGSGFSTTSSNYWASLGLAFSTTSADYWETQQAARGGGSSFSTTSANYWASLGLGFSTTSATYFAGASTTIAKTYSANSFTALQTFTFASTSVLSASSALCIATDCRTSWPSGSGGNGLATSTAVVDNYIAVGTSADDVGFYSNFTFDNAANLFTAPYASTTQLSASSFLWYPAGSVSAPGLRLSGTQSGIYSSGVDISFGIGGNSILQMGAGGILPQIYMGTQHTGSSAETSYSFSGDADTGMWRSAANTLVLTAGATDALVLRTSGASTTNLSVATSFDLFGTAYTTLASLGAALVNAITSATPTGTWDFGGATFLEIPNGTNPTADDPGEIAHDTTDNQLILDDFVVGKAVDTIWKVTVASTSPAFISGGLLAFPAQLDGYTITAIRCYVSGGTSKVVAVEDASANSTEDITCGTTLTSDDGSITNATFTAGELGNIDFGSTSGSVDYVTISVFGTWTRE